MLRRRKRDVSSNKVRNADSESDVKKSRNHPKSVSLGSQKQKKTDELALESKVLGGEEQLLNTLLEQSKAEKVTSKKDVSSQERRPAWEDEEDITGEIEKKRQGKTVGVSSKEYTERLKEQFERISAVPTWAKLPADKPKQQDDEEFSVDDLLQRTGDYLAPSASLPKGILQIKPCTDANKESPLKGKIMALEFHPKAQVLLTGGLNNTLSLFQVDGKTNSKIQSVFVENFPLFSAHFTADGEEVVMGSKHRGFKYYDMIAGKIVKVPAIKGLEENNMKNFDVSPDGRFLVFRGEYGAIHLISAKTKEWIHTLKMNGTVESVAFNSNGSTMYSHGGDGQVYVWDLNARECIHTFMDEGCIQGTTIAVSPNNQYLACGSSSGVVNLYETNTCMTSQGPAPLRAIMNLTTACTAAKFNATSEVLALSSNLMERAVKLVHVSSLSVFSNFPDRADQNIRLPTCLDFSLNSGYFTIGSHKGRALLYRLKHYKNY